MPLRVILNAINSVFDSAEKNTAVRRPIKSLLYCKDEIETQFAAWSAMQTGKNSIASKQNAAAAQSVPVSENEMFPPETVAAHLQTVIAALGQAANENFALRQLLTETAARLKELKNTPATVEELETELERADRLIDENLRRAADPKELKLTAAAFEKKLAVHRATMEDAVYQRTADLMLLKHLREEAKIPRLSLFYL